jgi:uncharacterized repeat protein (TIGR03833 family)
MILSVLTFNNSKSSDGILPVHKAGLSIADGGDDSMQHTERKNIRPGLSVQVVQKPHQRTGQLTEGIVQDILTSSPVHSRGIKVRLTSGIVGRVQKILTPIS